MMTEILRFLFAIFLGLASYCISDEMHAMILDFLEA